MCGSCGSGISVSGRSSEIRATVCPLCASLPAYVNMTVNWDDAGTQILSAETDGQNVIATKRKIQWCLLQCCCSKETVDLIPPIIVSSKGCGPILCFVQVVQ